MSLDQAPEINVKTPGLSTKRCRPQSHILFAESAPSESVQFIAETAVLVPQFLESYKSVMLASMAGAFGVSAEFMDAELADFIVAGRLTAKIDKVAGVIETNRRAHIFVEIIHF